MSGDFSFIIATRLIVMVTPVIITHSSLYCSKCVHTAISITAVLRIVTPYFALYAWFNRVFIIVTTALGFFCSTSPSLPLFSLLRHAKTAMSTTAVVLGTNMVPFRALSLWFSKVLLTVRVY
jgi:hypothetical protein